MEGAWSVSTGTPLRRGYAWHKIDIVVDGEVHTLSAGDFIHIEPGEVHYVNNPYDEPIVMVSTLAPFQEVDKVEVENPTY